MPPSQPALAQCLNFRHCGDIPMDHNILVNDFLRHARLLVYDKDDTVIVSRGTALHSRNNGRSPYGGLFKITPLWDIFREGFYIFRAVQIERNDVKIDRGSKRKERGDWMSHRLSGEQQRRDVHQGWIPDFKGLCQDGFLCPGCAELMAASYPSHRRRIARS